MMIFTIENQKIKNIIFPIPFDIINKKNLY